MIAKTNKHNPKGCQGCIYRSGYKPGWCNFSDIAGVTRHTLNAPLFYNGGCRLKKTKQMSTADSRRRWNQYVLRSEKPKQKPSFIDFGLIERLYNEGKNDEQIAREAGVGSSTVGRWRERNGLKSNYTIQMQNRKQAANNGG